MWGMRWPTYARTPLRGGAGAGRRAGASAGSGRHVAGRQRRATAGEGQHRSPACGPQSPGQPGLACAPSHAPACKAWRRRKSTACQPRLASVPPHTTDTTHPHLYSSQHSTPKLHTSAALVSRPSDMSSGAMWEQVPKVEVVTAPATVRARPKSQTCGHSAQQRCEQHAADRQGRPAQVRLWGWGWGGLGGGRGGGCNPAQGETTQRGPDLPAVLTRARKPRPSSADGSTASSRTLLPAQAGGGRHVGWASKERGCRPPIRVQAGALSDVAHVCRKLPSGQGNGT